jgi:hypothetical protein
LNELALQIIQSGIADGDSVSIDYNGEKVVVGKKLRAVRKKKELVKN